MSGRRVELIIARNLISSLELAALIVDDEGVVRFFNDSAGQLLEQRFEDAGPLPREEWHARFGPFDGEGEPLLAEDLPAVIALRDGSPVNGRFTIRTASGNLTTVELSALPLVTSEGFAGAVVAFWRPDEVADAPPA
jgi:PAS domain-containing protein